MSGLRVASLIALVTFALVKGKGIFHHIHADFLLGKGNNLSLAYVGSWRIQKIPMTDLVEKEWEWNLIDIKIQVTFPSFLFFFAFKNKDKKDK